MTLSRLSPLRCFLLVLLALALAMGGCEVDDGADAGTTTGADTGSSSGSVSSTETVTISDNGASPVAVTISVGGTVTFNNTMSGEADLLFGDNNGNLLIGPGASGSKTFTSAGAITYSDTNNTGTQGTINVQ